MKLKLKKDIIIAKGTIFNNCDNITTAFIHDNYDHIFALDKDTSMTIIVGSENKEYFEVVK